MISKIFWKALPWNDFVVDSVIYQKGHTGSVDIGADFEDELTESFLSLRLIVPRRCTVGLKQSLVPL